MFKFNNKNTRTMLITSTSTFTCSNSTIGTLKNMWTMSKVNNKNTRTTSITSKHISHFFLMFLLFTLSKWMLAGLKLFERKKLLWNNFRTNRCSEKIHKNYRKITDWSLFLIKLQGYCKFFVGDYFSNFQWYLIQ